MKLKDYPFNKEIHTSEELEKYIGMPIYFSSKKRFDNTIAFAWIKTVHKVVILSDGVFQFINTIDNLSIWGYNTLIVKGEPTEKKEYFLFNDDYTELKTSYIQNFARTLTKEEFEMYRKKTIKRRLLCQP